MRPLILASLMLLTVLSPLRDAQGQQDAVVVISIKGEIERGLVYVVRRGLHDAARRDARAVILEMNTPGGSVAAVEEIMDMLLKTPRKTITFVNNDAISGGALVAFATDEIWMAPASMIGAAAPVMIPLLPTGGTAEQPETMEQKSVSVVLALARRAAQRKGHNSDVAEAMIDPDKELRFGGRTLSEIGKLLTLTTEEASAPGPDGRPLLTAGVAEDLDDLLAQKGWDDLRIERMAETGAEQIARFLTSTAVTSLLLMGGLLGIYIEIRTPGFGLPGILGIACFGLFFFGQHIAGLAGMEEILILLAGLVLVGIELFILPGFGIVGAIGAMLVLAALALAMVGNVPQGRFAPNWAALPDAILPLSIAMLGAAVVAALIARFLPGIPGLNRLILAAEARSADGYVAQRGATFARPGERGVALTDLRPAGNAVFGERRLDVVTRGDWIKRRTPVRVVEIEGVRVVVEPDNPPDGASRS